jgi:hypothetical protein
MGITEFAFLYKYKICRFVLKRQLRKRDLHLKRFALRKYYGHYILQLFFQIFLFLLSLFIPLFYRPDLYSNLQNFNI